MTEAATLDVRFSLRPSRVSQLCRRITCRNDNLHLGDRTIDYTSCSPSPFPLFLVFWMRPTESILRSGTVCLTVVPWKCPRAACFHDACESGEPTPSLIKSLRLMASLMSLTALVAPEHLLSVCLGLTSPSARKRSVSAARATLTTFKPPALPRSATTALASCLKVCSLAVSAHCERCALSRNSQVVYLQCLYLSAADQLTVPAAQWR